MELGPYRLTLKYTEEADGTVYRDFLRERMIYRGAEAVKLVQRRSQWARFGAAADHDDPGITAVSPDDVVIEDPFSESAGQTDTEKLIDKLRQGVAGKSRRN